MDICNIYSTDGGSFNRQIFNRQILTDKRGIEAKVLLIYCIWNKICIFKIIFELNFKILRLLHQKIIAFIFSLISYQNFFHFLKNLSTFGVAVTVTRDTTR